MPENSTTTTFNNYKYMHFYKHTTGFFRKSQML